MLKRTIFLLSFIIMTATVSIAQKVVYSSDINTPDYYQIFISDLDGSNAKQLTNMYVNCLRPRFSPDGTMIVFYTESENSYPGVYLIKNADSETPDDPLYIAEGTHPSFIDDQGSIMFNSDINGYLSIFAKALEDSEAFEIAPPGYANQQIISNDYTKIVFSAYFDGNKTIMLIDFNDESEDNLYKVSENSNSNLNPDISRDNMNVVYSSFNQELKGTIYISKAGKESPLTKDIQSADLPKFSPSGDVIAFLNINDNSVKLYTMDINGKSKKNIKVKNGNIGGYKWIDDERIIYDVEDGSNYKIGIVNIVTGENSLIVDSGSSLFPDVYLPR